MLYRIRSVRTRCPLGFQSHIAARHCEFIASIKHGFAVDGFAIHFPAGKGVACALELSGFIPLYCVKESFVNLILFATIPGAAIQIICHRTTGNILCVVICRSVHRLRHRNRTIGKGRIGIPTLECVCYTALIFCLRECYIRHIRRFGFPTGDVVLAAQKLGCILSYILQIIPYRGNFSTLDLNITVDMIIRFCIVIMRDLCGNNANFCNIIFGDGHSKLFFHRCLIAVENRIPVLRITITIHNLVAIRPINHSIFNIGCGAVSAFIGIPHHPGCIDRYLAILISKELIIIRVHISARVYQIVDLCRCCA